jgi:hypothetical protein
MKVETKVGNVFMSEGLTVHKARIKINRQSFKILYGDLYSDKIRAVVRELSTNAHDSHITAGKPETPFEIHLPNELEPFFYVKDFGTGLSPEQVYGEEDGIYITFCDSNKIHSDDFTGCLGLGSKSPLTYTDNFSVESNYNGVKYSYAMFLDEEGEPCITPLGACDTTEPNGLKVEFAVKEKDFSEFSGKVAEVLSWFKVRPTVVGDPHFKFEERTYLRKTERYGVHKERQEESNVIMGNVAYPIRAHDFSYNKLDDVERAVVEYGVDLFVDIGDVEFVPSREKLSYTEKTIANVRKYLADAIKSIREELESQVLAQPSVWSARRMLHDIKHSILGKVRSLGTVMYHDKEIAEYINFHKMVEKTMPGMDRTNPQYPKLEVLWRRKEHYRRRDEDNINCDGQRIYLNDLKHGGYARILKHVRDIGGAAYMMTGVSQEFLDYTGVGEVAIKASSLPPIERAKREVINSDGTRNYIKRTVLQEYVPSGGNYMTDWWADVEVDPRAGGVYVVCSYGQIVDGELKTLPSEIKRRYLAVKALRPDFKLYGIRPAHMGRIEKYKHRWTKFDDYAELVLKSEFPQVVEKIQLIRQYENLDSADRYEKFVNEVFEEYSTFGQFMAKFKEAKALVADVKVWAVLKLNEQVKNSLPMEGEAQELNQLAEKLDEAYPMMQYVDWWRGRNAEFTAHFAEYIRGIDDRNYKASLQPIKEAV